MFAILLSLRVIQHLVCFALQSHFDIVADLVHENEVAPDRSVEDGLAGGVNAPLLIKLIGIVPSGLQVLVNFHLLKLQLPDTQIHCLLHIEHPRLEAEDLNALRLQQVHQQARVLSHIHLV